LSTELASPPVAAKTTRWRQLTSTGPGIVFVAAAVGGQDLVTGSAAGASYGYGLLWALALSVLARFIFLEATARYVLATGESLVEGFARLGRWALWLLLISILIKRHASNLYQVLLLGFAASWLLPLPFAGGTALWSLVFWTGGFALMYWGRYRAVERLCRPLVLLLGGSLAAIAILSGPRPVDIAKGFLPTLGTGEEGLFGAAFVLMALVGSATGSISNIKYSAFIHEKGWRDRSYLGEQRIDLAKGALGLLLAGVMIQIAAAGLFGPESAVLLQEPEQLITGFAGALGEAGRIVVALGVWAAVFSTYLGANTGYSLIASDVIANLKGQRDGVAAGRRPAYRWVLVGFVFSPVYALWTDWSPVWLVLFASALQLAMLPVMTAMLLLLTAGKRMGYLRNGIATNLFLAGSILASIALIGRACRQWLAG
jgi:Mn2+/Fe2+ NRAMP family transporter